MTTFYKFIRQEIMGSILKKVLLIHPWIEDFSAYDFWIKPLGLLTVGTLLRRAGLEIGLIDCVDRGRLNAPDKQFGKGEIPSKKIVKPKVLEKIPRHFKRFGLNDKTFRENAAAFGRPDLVLTTCMMTYWYSGAFRATRMIKEIYPDVPVGLGGNYVTLCLNHAERYSGADLLFPEKGLDIIIKKIQDILEIKNIPIQSTLPRIDYSFYPELRSIPLLTSQGCPYRCTYCAASRLYPRFVQKNPETILDEIEFYFQRFGVRDFAFYDDALLVNAQSHLNKILKGVLERGLDLRFHLPNAVHAEAVTPETAELMYQAGFKTIRIGLESSDPSFQKRDSAGKLNNQQFLKGVGLLKNAGFTSSELGAYVLCGLPEQTGESVMETLDMVHKTGIRIYLSTFSPVPGTPCFIKMSKLEPGILKDPLVHNKHVSIFRDGSLFRLIKERTNQYNHFLDQKNKQPISKEGLYKTVQVD